MYKFLFILVLMVFSNLDAKPLTIKVSAKSAILMNPKNGAVLFEKKAHEPHHPASITKIATALFILDQKKIDFQTPFTCTKEALNLVNASLKHAAFHKYPPYILEHDGVSLGLTKGEVYTLQTLLHGLLLFSSNDAANVLAENICGSIDTFMNEMNLYLKSKGIKQTNFVNPHGLHHPLQVVTAHEMAQIASHAFLNDTFREIIKTRIYEDPIKNKKIINTNPLLKKGQYHYPKTIGGKTGFIAISGFNLVAAAEENGRLLIAVLLGCKTKEERYEDAIRLFETAFQEKLVKRVLFPKDYGAFTKEIEHAKGKLQAHIQDEVAIEYFPSEERELKAELIWYKMKLPIAVGEKVGEVRISDTDGQLLATAPLFATEPLKKKLFYRLF